jgi:predicted RNase H-like HicB family nuclease
MGDLNEIELVLEPQKDGGYHVYAPDLPSLHTQGNDIDDAMANASEAVALYVEGLRDHKETRMKNTRYVKKATSGRGWDVVREGHRRATAHGATKADAVKPCEI